MNATKPLTVLDFWRDILAKGYPKGVAIEEIVAADATYQQVIGGRRDEPNRSA